MYDFPDFAENVHPDYGYFREILIKIIYRVNF